MLIKKSEAKSLTKTVFLTILVLIAFTGIFKLYHDSKYVKGEYEIVCPQNYGDPISLERCYWPYKFEGESLLNALKIEVGAIVVAPLLIYFLSLI